MHWSILRYTTFCSAMYSAVTGDQLYICTSIRLQLLTSHILIVPHWRQSFHISVHDDVDDDDDEDDDDPDDDDNDIDNISK